MTANTTVSNATIALKENSLIRWSAILLWASVATLCIGLYLVSIGADYNDYATICDGVRGFNSECTLYNMASVEAEVLQSWGYSLQQYALYMTSIGILAPTIYFMLGFLVFWRLGITPIGLTVSLALIVFPFFVYASGRVWADMHPILSFLGVLAVIPTNMIAVTFILVFPNGRFSPSWAKYVWLILNVDIVLLILYINDLITLPEPLSTILYAIAVGFILLAFAFQAYRYRYDSSPVERQQNKWIASGIVAYLLGTVVWALTWTDALGLEVGARRLVLFISGTHITYTLLAMLPIGITIAMLRYRLWDIDVIIRRTLIYSVVSALLALIYFVIVLVTQNFLSGFIPEDNTLLIVGSTLAVAALFNPLQQRVQHVIDRIFYRNRYDAEATLDQFSEKIRDAMDVDAIEHEVIQAVTSTIQPETISLWVVEKPRS